MIERQRRRCRSSQNSLWTRTQPRPDCGHWLSSCQIEITSSIKFAGGRGVPEQLRRASQTARALLGAGAVPFPRSVPPGIWARNLLVARRAEVGGTLDRGEASEKDQVEEATTEAKAFDQGLRNKAVDEDLDAAKRQRDVALKGLERAEDLTAYLQKQLLELGDSSSEKAKEVKQELKDAKKELKEAKKELKEAEQKYKAKASVQAKAALRAEDLGQPSHVRVPAAKVQDGQRLVRIDACVKACMDLIEKYINQSDGSVTNRVPPTCAARCARGGKTTFLQKLGERLAEAQYLPIFVSFNGESPVKRRDNELADEWLYRTIAYALLPAGTLRQDVAAEFGTVTCGEKTLESYFKSQKNVVLLVDELNQLLLKSPTEEEKKAEQRGARFMKNAFLGAEGAYMVFTSHIQSTGLDLTQYMEGDSVRGLEITGLPFAAELEELQNMSTAFSGLTHMKAAYYSRVPALLWSSHDDGSLLSQKFSQIQQHPKEHLAAFLCEVFGGTPLREIEAFRQLTDGSQKDRAIWIPCFMSHFLIQCSVTWPACGVLGRWLQGMQAAEEKDGKAWEKVIAVAFGLRYIWQQMGGDVHGWLHGHEGAAIQCLDANPAAKTVEDAIQQLPQPLQYPTLQLVLPSHAQFEAVDLFAVRREADSTDLVMVAQQKEGSASVSNHPRPQTAKHAYWMRGSSTQNAKTKGGWFQPSQSEIETFLGPSLAVAAPATWRDPVD
eukprot:s7064_g1.t2